MTAPTINGTRYPQPIEDLLPAARALDLPDGEVFPSRNRLMREFRIGAPKAGELLALLKTTPAAPPADTTEPATPDPAPEPAAPEPAPPVVPDPTPAPEITPPTPLAEVAPVSRPDTPPAPARSAVVWPVVLLALPAFVAIWSGWVGLGGLTGFGIVHPLPGIWDSFSINSAITLPIGVETYGAYALYVWLSGRVPERARRFAKWSALGSLAIGALGQVAYHLLEAAGVTSAPWWITTAVACLPVAVLGMGAALAHLVRTHD
ncbi:ABC transporter permease [Micromonospora saelicesensis]|uniref:ABC transporter permease n=1 Tax=Micromonospora saelicesensis TaxID=285676 RepID=UPI000DC33210|nr:ABC transporter permease [Micromonospora saelicesensis]RAO54406.1 Lysine-rich arabinogalactan protein [Micromonospora saelicesensis]